MGEPGPVLSAPERRVADLLTLVRHDHPGAQLDQIDGQWIVLTLHSVGTTEIEALEAAISQFKHMKANGESVRTMLDEVADDLRSTPGMSKVRHELLTESLDMISTALNDGVVTKSIPWITVPGLTREIEELRRRVDMRLAMKALEMQEAENAHKRAGMKFPRPTETPNDGLTPFQRLKRATQA